MAASERPGTPNEPLEEILRARTLRATHLEA
jgi:hypothetical protein